MLEAWLGNNTNASTPWEPILDKIDKLLNFYSKSHPMLDRRKVIMQIVIGGYMQFLTKAQGMPKQIEKALTQMTHNFIWEENTSPRVTLDHLHKSIEKGGLNLLNTSARNEAIELVWLKSYLNLSPSQPTWAKLMDIILDASAPPSTNIQARLNTFLQTWNPPLWGKWAEKINNDTRRMLETAKAYNTNFASIQLTQEIKQKLLAWYQLGAKRRPMHNQLARCLLSKHNIKMLADLMKASGRLRHPIRNPGHHPTNYCNCQPCREDRDKNCTHPHDYATEALARLQLTIPIMNPLDHGTGHNNLSLT